MFLPRNFINRTLQNCQAQLLLPAVLLLPLFVLVIYLLVEVTNVSITKVQHQFALDNAAYSQVSSVSTFMNILGILNGPLAYRNMALYDQVLVPNDRGKTDPQYNGKNVTVFDLFFRAGAVSTVAPNYDWGAVHNPHPKPDSQNWGVHYAKYDGIEGEGTEESPNYDRSGWEKETPDAIKGPVYLTNRDIADKFYVAGLGGNTSKKAFGLTLIMDYLSVYIQIGDIYNLNKDLYQKLIRNAGIFREGYYLNVGDCKKGECARQSAQRLANYLSIPTKRQDIAEPVFFVSASQMKGDHSGAIAIPLQFPRDGADPLFQFAYVEPIGRSRLRALRRGILLKQAFPLPKNYFNINLASKYKPYVRNTVILSCPRANNNCVWPNPLPKYNVVLRP